MMDTKKILAKKLEPLIDKKKDENYKNSVPQQAEEMGIPYQTFAKYINGTSECPAKNLIKIAQYYDVTTDYLLGLNPNPTTDADKSAVCLYTGLSQSSVEKVVSITKIPSRPGLIDLSKALNSFLSGSHLVSFIMLFWNFMREADKLKQLEIVFVDKLESFGEKRPKSIVSYAAKLSLEPSSCVHAEALELTRQNDQVRYAMFRLQNSLNSITDEYMEEGE